MFLHQVTPNTAWRNVGLASLAPDGSTQLKNPPLALDLHYLLTAYAGADTEAEALLGYAVLMVHENPVLARNEIRTGPTKSGHRVSGQPAFRSIAILRSGRPDRNDQDHAGHPGAVRNWLGFGRP